MKKRFSPLVNILLYIAGYLAMFSLLVFMPGCHFVSSFMDDEDEDITLSFDVSKTSVSMGAMDVINLTADKNQNSASISWEYDEDIIFAKTDNYSAVITGLAAGTTTLTARCGSSSASCVVTVSSDTYAATITNPYVYASCDYVSVAPGSTTKISAALFGGQAGDLSGFTWSIDKPSIASISTEGNYCWITGVSDGIAKVTVKHTKAAYGYSVLVDCRSDGTNSTYITTTDNIITINLSETNTTEFSVDLVNSPITDYYSLFEFSVVDSLGNEMSEKPADVTNTAGLAVTLTAYEAGECYIRCKHPNAVYSLDILVRVIENAETSYIEPSQSIVTVSDSDYETVSLSLVNYSGETSSDKFSWEFSENADQFIDYTIYNGSSDSTGDKISLKGIKTGSVKISVSYPGVPSRSIIVLVRDVASEAADAATYITTSQNYVRLSTDDDSSTVYVTLKNGSESDLKDLQWKITSTAADGSGGKVIDYKTGTGSATFSSRAVIASNAQGYAVITPVSAGTAYIDVSHPKALYSTRITVVVSEKTTSEQKSVLTLSGSPVVTVKNGEDTTVSVLLSGSASSDDIVWSTDGSVTLTPNGSECVITAPVSGSGGAKCSVTASLEDSSVVFSVTTYDTEEEMEANLTKVIYTLSDSASISEGESHYFYVAYDGFADGGAPDISYSVLEGSDCISFETEYSNTALIVTGTKAGNAVIKASAPGCSDISFTVTVIAKGIIAADEDCYISTSENVLYFSAINTSKDLSINLYNIDESVWSSLTWEVSNSDFEVASNSNHATVTCLSSDSSATLTVSHPLSQNQLVIYLKSGSQYEYVNEDSCYISTSKDVLNLYAGQDEVSFTATINHTEESDAASVAKGFSFSIDDESVAKISYVNYSNTCYVKPLKNGTAKITVRHDDADFEKEVVVIVDQAPDASSVPYITSSQNVITIIQGEYETATVELVNSTTISNSAWHWSSLDSKVCDVVANNGTSAMLCANNPGTVEIKVSHDDCPYSFKFIVVVLDASVAVTRPYISTGTNILTLQKGSSTTLQAEMVGSSTPSDSNYFRFKAGSSATILVNSSGSGAAYVKALETGLTYITVSNSRYSDSYSKTILVVVEDTQETGVYISPSQNIVKLEPDETELTIITATLVNGEDTDGQDFIWWADDYNLIGMTTVAEQCSILPTGKSGTTKIHVKHAKAAKQADILVMVSSYDEFAFSENSANIKAENLYFYPLQIPALEESFTVKYSSSNPKVCLVDGSNSVAWVCGLSYGQANLTASMVSEDGTVIASAEMLVSVEVIDPVLPVISLGQSILTAEAGSSVTVSASLSGDDLEETEKYKLRWSVKNKDDGISLMNTSSDGDGNAYGADCYITFPLTGESREYVLTCSYDVDESTTVSADLYIVVEEKGEVTISLSSNLETVYKDDGSFSLTATLENASEDDYKNIEWSAVKVGGQSIVAVSKTKGANCTVSPKNVGQTSVIAKLPNGKTARCIVIVKASAEILLDVAAVHVIPGYTEVINYKTNPENSTINWYSVMTQSSSSMSSYTNYFTYEDDTAKKQLRITGKKDYTGGVAGTITASMVGASASNLPSIKVYVEYDLELRVEDTDGNTLTLLYNDCPDTANVKTFNVVYYPVDLDIDIKDSSSDEIIACLPSEGNTALHEVDSGSDAEVSIGNISRSYFTEDGFEKCRMTVTLVPHTECSKDITVCASLPVDESGTYSQKRTFRYTAEYEDYDFEVEEFTKTGAFTRFSKDSSGAIDGLFLGDGEEAVFYVKIRNENAKGTVENVEITHTDTTFVKTQNNIMLDDFWKTNTETDRSELKNLIFSSDKDTTTKVWKSNFIGSTPQYGLLYLSKDENTGTAGQTIWHLSHNWDYYQDLPDAYDNWDDLFEPDKNTVNVDGSNFNNNFFCAGSASKLDNVDYFLVSKEIRYKGAYAFPHDGKNKITPKWEMGLYEKHHGWRWCWHYRRNVTLKYNGKKVLFYQNNNEDRNINVDLTQYLEAFQVDPIYNAPFVITKEELLTNYALVRPVAIGSYDNESIEGEKKGNSERFSPLAYRTDNCNDSNHYLSKLLSRYITPTVSKDSTVRESIHNGAMLVIKYKKGYAQTALECQKKIPLTVEIRACEAYTNQGWTQIRDGGYTRWKLNSSAAKSNSKNWLFIDDPNVSYSTAEIAAKGGIVQVPYEVKPADSTITVSVPEASKVADAAPSYTVVSTGTKTDEDDPTAVIGTGYIEFKINGAYTDNVQVKAVSSLGTKNVKIMFAVDSDDCFYPEISSRVAYNMPSVSGSHSYVDTANNMIVIGDGEKVTGSFKNTDTLSLSKIHSVSWVNLENNCDYAPSRTETLTADYPVTIGGEYYNSVAIDGDDNYNGNGWTDGNVVFWEYGTDVSEDVTHSITQSGDTWNFEFAHKTDYGYFGYGSGKVQDRFFGKNFSVPKDIFDVDNNNTSPEKLYYKGYCYNTKYPEQSVYNDVGVSVSRKSRFSSSGYEYILHFKEKENPLYYLNQKKLDYATEVAGKALTSSTTSYYFEDGNEVNGEGSKTYSLTPVGLLRIDYNFDSSKSGDAQTDSKIFYVYLRVGDDPCASTSDYGYAVPESAYLDTEKYPLYDYVEEDDDDD